MKTLVFIQQVTNLRGIQVLRRRENKKISYIHQLRLRKEVSSSRRIFQHQFSIFAHQKTVNKIKMYAQPDYPAALASLQRMTSDQLKEILNRFVLVV